MEGEGGGGDEGRRQMGESGCTALWGIGGPCGRTVCRKESHLYLDEGEYTSLVEETVVNLEELQEPDFVLRHGQLVFA